MGLEFKVYLAQIKRNTPSRGIKKNRTFAPSKTSGCGVMVAAPDLGSGGESRGGSSPPIRTI